MSAIVTSSHFAIGLFALWFLYFVCWREHRIDTYRQRLFKVRDELFDFAASGAIKFDDPAYVKLRNLSNGLIRFAHRINFTRMLVVASFDDLPDTNPMEAWETDVRTRSKEVRKKLLSAHEEIRKVSVLYVLAWSPFAWLFVISSYVFTVLRAKSVIIRVPPSIPQVLEKEALEQSSLREEEGCLTAV